jgi:hypothetical protein
MQGGLGVGFQGPASETAHVFQASLLETWTGRTRPTSERLDELAKTRQQQMRPKSAMKWSTETSPNLIKKNPPPIWHHRMVGLDVPWKNESIPPPAQLKLTIRGQYGANYTVRVYPEETVLRVKQIIKDMGGVAPECQRMYLPPLTLQNDTPVGAYDDIESRVINVFEERD